MRLEDKEDPWDVDGRGRGRNKYGREKDRENEPIEYE